MTRDEENALTVKSALSVIQGVVGNKEIDLTKVKEEMTIAMEQDKDVFLCMEDVTDIVYGFLYKKI